MKYLSLIWIGAVIMMVSVVSVYGETMPNNQQWKVVNDGVMGGLSESQAVLDHDSLIFSGTISFENNGGFASIRHTAEGFNLQHSSGIRLRVWGDGKKYQFRVRTNQRFDGVAYKHEFMTVENEWLDVELKWSDFEATFRGQKVNGAPELEAGAIKQVGFLISDKQEGPFELKVKQMLPLKAP